MREDYTIAILGCGVMGTAVLSAIVNSKPKPYPKKIICCTGSSKSAAKLQSTYGDSISTSFGNENIESVKEADIIILGCKPYMCETIMNSVSSALRKDQLLISLLAGWTIKQLSNYSTFIARVMTNTPAKYGCGTAVVSFSDNCKEYEDLVMKLIDPVGMAIKLPEKNMDAATSLVGSGPAFCLLMMESLIDGGVRMGIPFNVARDCAAKVMEGTAKMVLQTGEHPGSLKSAICTPGGTTIGGIMVMEDKGVRSGISRAVEEAANIATSLGKK